MARAREYKRSLDAMNTNTDFTDIPRVSNIRWYSGVLLLMVLEYSSPFFFFHYSSSSRLEHRISFGRYRISLCSKLVPLYNICFIKLFLFFIAIDIFD